MKTRRTAMTLALLAAYSAAQGAIDSTRRSPCAPSEMRGAQPRWFDYEVASSDGVGIAQVCNDAQGTYIVFGEAIPPALRIAERDGREVAFQRHRQHVAVDGLYTELTVEAGDGSTTLVLRPEVLPPAIATAEETEAAEPPQPAPASAEDGEMQFASAGEPTPVQAEESASATASSRLARVGFGFDSATLALSDQEKQDLLDLVAKARRIELRGRTDSIGSAAYNQRLALKRAQAVRDFLVAQGIDPEAVTVSAAPNTDYIATNDSEAGRAQNRRVDIVAIQDDDTPIAVGMEDDVTPAETVDPIALLD